ncbi:TonB-dependent receptor [Gemmatimonadetes bacterium T265]|nr:TonB-dependent receptor [Gemmatimonadetes bacterium T265]
MPGVRHLFGAAPAAIACVAGLAATARAQSTNGTLITGTVASARAPVVGATVRLVELDRVTRTDARGEFRFADLPRGTYRVFVIVPGFAAASARVVVGAAGAPAPVAFALTPSAVPLQEVVVSASPVARPAAEEVQSTASKGRVALLDSPGASFAEKLADVPGVTVRQNGSAPSRPILRGLGDNEVLVLENGLRTGDIATYDPAHATPIEAIGVAQVDVVRGPATILYGPSTIGGVVNVITSMIPEVADHPLSGTVAAEGNTVNDQAAGYVNAVASGEHQAFRLSAGGVHAQDTRIPAGVYTDPASGAAFDLRRLPQTFDRSAEAGAGYAYQGGFGSAGVGFKHYEMNYGIPGVPPNADFEAAPPTTSRIAQRRNTLEGRALFAGDGAVAQQWRVTASYNDYTHSEFPTAQDSTGVSSPQANHFHKRELNAVVQLQHRPVGRLTGTLGLWTDVQDLTIAGDQPLGPNSRTTGVAGYAFEEYQADAATRLQGAVRYDYNGIRTRPYPASTDSVFQTLRASRRSDAVTASLGAIRQLTPHVTGTFSVARSFRAPTVQELFANGLDAASGTYSVGTAGLGPETGLGVDASLRGTFDRVTFAVSPFANTIHHYIYGFLRGDTIQAFPVRQFAATDARLLGGEASLSVQPAEHVALGAATDYVRAEDTDHHVPLPFIPPLRGLLRGTYEDQTYRGTVEWRLAARQTRLGDGDTPTGGYGVVNVGAGVRFVQRGAREGVVHHLALHVDNVFNRVYRDNLSVIKDFLPQPGRGVRLTYELAY